MIVVVVITLGSHTAAIYLSHLIRKCIVLKRCHQVFHHIFIMDGYKIHQTAPAHKTD